MPLLKKKALEKKPIPEGLKDDEEVFHCEVTNEIFRDYEEFAERTILCNSMVWTCAMTGRSNLTYVEALQSEENARISLKDFPLELRIPVLYLANKTKRSSFTEMADDIFTYIKERYFVGENVEASFSGNKWREYHVLQVICPSTEELQNLPRINGSTDKSFFPPPLVYKYDLEQLDNEDDDVIEKMIADFTQIRRRKGTYTREKNKLFLKQYAEQNTDGMCCIKESVLKDFGLTKFKFDQIFDGPLPEFEVSKKTKTAVNGKKVRQETLAKYLSKNNILEGKEQRNNLLDEMKKRQIEFKKAKEELKIKTAEEKLAEKQKKKEENLKTAHMYREWYKSKDDLELEDQKKLPELTTVKTSIAERYLGDVFTVLEFVNSFSKILSTKDFFPGGFTIDIMERALAEKEVAGPLIDVIQMFLNAIFALQEEEATQTKTHTECIRHEIKKMPEEPSLEDNIKFATWSSTWPRKYHGVPLSKLPMYSLTVSEILRLHLLSSGARINEVGARWRFQQRGGYTSEDDPGLYLRQSDPKLLHSLGVYNVVQLSTDDKLKIITCLIDQLLTYADVRDVIEERIENVKQNKLDLKTIQFTEKKRCAEVISAKSKLKSEMNAGNRSLTLELEKIEKETSRQQAEYEKKVEKLMRSTNEHQVILGYDRGYRRYVKLDSVPGVFIDTCEINCGTCLSEIIHHEHKLVGANKKDVIQHLKETSDEMNTSDKENHPKELPIVTNGAKNSHDEVKLCQELFMCSADPDNCVVHSANRNNHSWKFIQNEEQLDELINSLNKRGIRESELLNFLQTNHNSLLKSISNTPDYLLNSDIDDSNRIKPIKKWKNRYDDANFGYPISTDPVQVLRATLIEVILEMEEKISAGNLGSLKVKDRSEWRKCLAECNFANFDRVIISSIENGKIKDDDEDERDSRESTPDTKIAYYRDPGCTIRRCTEDNNVDNNYVLLEKQKEIIECLSIALAQVAHSVESRYLKKPLGHCDIKKEDIKIPKDVLKYWEQSLLGSTSYSQVFLHYGTLDGCIMWSRSALLARCRVCKRQSDSENMLLCDNCNYGYHLYCLKPKLGSIPQGEWFCYKCLKEKEKEFKLLNPEPETKKKRRIFRDEEVDDEEEETHNMEVDKTSEKDHDSGGEDTEIAEVKSEVCITCGSGGELLSCDKCPNIYHIECVQPPLRRRPRGVWLCVGCREKKAHKDNDDTFSRAQRTGVLQNQRRCATRARLKIHGFVKSLRGGLSSDDSDDSTEISSVSRRCRREAEDLPLHNAELQDLLSEIMKHKDAWPFIRPVQKNEVPDYYDVITKPMDFGTIKYKLNMGKYTCDEEFMSDAVLIFENCNTYNDSDADVYRCGVRLLKVFEKKSKELGLKLPEEMQGDDNEAKERQNKKRRVK